MSVLRVVPNLQSSNPGALAQFYEDLFGLARVMDQGWIVSSATEKGSCSQINFAANGGSGTDVPHLSIEVEDVDAVYNLAVSKRFEIAYPITDEPWGLRRFFVQDPDGRLINVLSHIEKLK